jgi:hypothetical protein
MIERPKTLTVYLGNARAVYFAGAFMVDLEQRNGEVVLTVSQGKTRRRFALAGELGKVLAKVRITGEVVAREELDG